MARAVRPALPAMPADSALPHTLRDVLRATPRLAPERAAALLGGTARALLARGTAYGALTPERVLVGPGDAVSLAPPPGPSAPAPWPAYLAPEQIDGRPADARSDVYALGLLGWEMLAGRQPWEGESLYGIVVKQREHDLPRLSTLRPGLPRPLVQAVEGALHKAPDDRWQSVAEFRDALEPGRGRDAAAFEPAPVAAPVATPVAPVARPIAEARTPAARNDLWAMGAVPGTAREPEPPAPEPRAAPRREPAPRRSSPAGRRWLTVAALTLAILAAAAGAYAVVQGRQDSTATRAWLDSVTATGAGSAAAVTATTTRENTTSVPVRRTGGRAAAPPPDEPPPEAFDSTQSPPPDEPVLEPTPPLVPAPAARPSRPTVPPDTVLRPTPDGF